VDVETDRLQPESFEHRGARLAFRRHGGRAPTVVYLTGFNSSMDGRKASRVAGYCRARGLASLRFDHRGHGASTGNLAAGSIEVWYQDALALLTARLRGDLVLVGASMGVWIMLRLARGLGGPGEAQRQQRRLGAGRGQADRVNRGNGVDDHSRQLNLFGGRRPEACPAFDRSLKGAHDLRMGMAGNQRAP